MDALIILSYIAVILLLGVLCSFVSRKLSISNALLLLAAGILLSMAQYNGQSLIRFPAVFLAAIGIFALAMVVFDASSRLRLKRLDKLSLSALKLAITFFILNMVFLAFFTRWIFSIRSVFLALLFAALMSGTEPSAVVSKVGEAKSRIAYLLKAESLMNTPLIVLLPFVILAIMETFRPGLFFNSLISQSAFFLQQLIVGIGTGILIGVVIMKVMKKAYSELLSPFTVIAAALLAYIISESLKGNGILAVITLGIFFGNVYIKEKHELIEFSSVFASFLEILVFMLVGLIIGFQFNLSFFMKSFALFLIFLAIRFVSVNISLKKQAISMKEKVFMALNAQKGIAVAAVALVLTTYTVTQTAIADGFEIVSNAPFVNIPGTVGILDLTLAFIAYSMILSSIMLSYSKYFLKR